MADDKKQVIYDLERCTCHVPDACRDCSKHRHWSGNAVTCMESLMEDALDLLKEQEAMKKNRLPYSPDSNVQWT